MVDRVAVMLVGPRDQLFPQLPFEAAAYLSKRKIQKMKNMQTPRQRIQWKLVQVQLHQPSRPRVCGGLSLFSFYDDNDQSQVGMIKLVIMINFEMKC